jgi:hypothetical protein
MATFAYCSPSYFFYGWFPTLVCQVDRKGFHSFICSILYIVRTEVYLMFIT